MGLNPLVRDPQDIKYYIIATII